MRFVDPAGLAAATDADLVVVDLARPGHLEALAARPPGVDVVGFGPHVDEELLADAPRPPGATASCPARGSSSNGPRCRWLRSASGASASDERRMAKPDLQEEQVAMSPNGPRGGVVGQGIDVRGELAVAKVGQGHLLEHAPEAGPQRHPHALEGLEALGVVE